MENIAKIEAALLEHPSVGDCAVLVRTTEKYEEKLVAYVVPSEAFLPERLKTHLQDVLPAVELPMAYVPVSSIPLTAAGQVDEQSLSRLEVIDTGLVQQWEDRLQSVSEVEQAAVVIREKVERQRLVHLSSLLSDWKTTCSQGDGRQVEVTDLPYAVLENQGAKTLAISHGESLREEAGVPIILPEALQRAVLQSPEKGIVYIQPDGSEIFQSYPSLLEEAGRVLSGLRKKGLRPQDKVIFQFDRNQDFIPAFWGCVLGGFVPVPISVPPTYKELNSAVNKLYNAWQMLEQPVILTGKTVARSIRSLSDHLNLEGLRVEIVDDLSGCEPDMEWHVSQAGDPALMMLTSGSTGMPKGVILSHYNLLSRSAASMQMNGFSSSDITLNWMPLDHVAGIIYFHLRDVFLGCQQIHAPVELVLQEPLKWLDWIDHFRATVTFAPNFAYGLVNARAEELGRRHWDLSSMKFVLNGAEAIVAKTARRFLQLLAPHGLPATAMHPAWGMSETSSGVTYSDSFSLDSTKDDDPFVEVGAPIPGFSMRIVDDHDQVLEEGTVGCLQVKGATVTTGYFKNQELNREVFTEDGWFNTGDLGILRKGRLTITGREKDVVIINGINYYCHEIEAAVEEVSGVETSYTAACAVRAPSIDTDKLAIFFHPSSGDDDHQIHLLREIRKIVVKTVGVNPDYLIPVQKEDIPKTSIGKIQRSQLSHRFQAGEFDDILKGVDIMSGNANTIPDWFYRKIWRRKEEAALSYQQKAGPSLVFLDPTGLGKVLCLEMSKINLPYVTVETGLDFAKTDTDCYRINPSVPDHYRRLLKSISENNIRIAQIMHLWAYDEYAGEVSDMKDLEQAQQRGIYSLLFLVQALSEIQGSGSPVSLYFISSHTQPVFEDERISFEKAPVLGLLKTIPQEMPWLICRHIDLFHDSLEVNAAHILRELHIVKREREVAYRNGHRWVPRLKKIDLLQECRGEAPFKKGGMYLISGGLGGIGLEISRYLLQHYQVLLLLVGRTPLPDRNDWERCLRQKDALSQRIEACLELEQLGGEVVYESVDVCDLKRMQQVVEDAKSRWECDLSGIIHLAGSYHENTVIEETGESLSAMLRSKIMGTWALHQLVKDQRDGVFICFSSVAAFFGGAMVGAYSAANNFLDYFSYYQRYRSPLHHFCFAWSNWDGIGLSKCSRIKELSRARGYHPMTPEQALNSLLIGLQHDQGQLLVGLIGGNRHVRRYMEDESYPLQKLTAYLTTQNDSLSVDKFQTPAIQDCFKTQSICEFVKIPKMPVTEAGQIDRDKLSAIGKNIDQVTDDRISPRTELEHQIAGLWQEVLSVPEVGVHDNFFDLGGDSLLAVRLLSRVCETFQIELALEGLFEAPTVAGLATIVAAHRGKRQNIPLNRIDTIKSGDAENLLAIIDQMSDKEVDSLLINLMDETRIEE